MKSEPLNVPILHKPEIEWASDALAELLSQLDLPFIAMVPGSSYRGLHDSLVNYLGNSGPELVVCLHEEHSVAIAQGYAKVTGKPMLVGLHSNVGLMHAAMSIYNAYCDRAPMVILGATGPLDGAKRRPWIDWVHSSADQGALIRNYVKWDDQPGSIEDALDSVVRGNVLTRSGTKAPVYISLDCEMQEEPATSDLKVPDPSKYPVPVPAAPSAAVTAGLAERIQAAKRPVFLLGRTGRSEAEWANRVALAEALGVAVLTDLRKPACFPTEHPNHPARQGAGRLSASGLEMLRQSDLIVAVNWTEVEGAMRAAFPDTERPYVVNCRVMADLLNGWTKDYFTQVVSDEEITTDPDELVAALLAHVQDLQPVERPEWPPVFERVVAERPNVEGDEIFMADLAAAIRAATKDDETCFSTLPLGWSGEDSFLAHPRDYLGRDGGGGVGSGPGIAVGAALALDGTDRYPIAVIGDGDYLMGSSALWTAAHYRLPLLVIVANNRSYFNDEKHQEQMAVRRSRPVENRTVGQHLRDPDPDCAMIARGHGLAAHGPVLTVEDLAETLEKAMAEVRSGKSVLVDVRVNPHGYGQA